MTWVRVDDAFLNDLRSALDRIAAADPLRRTLEDLRDGAEQSAAPVPPPAPVPPNRPVFAAPPRRKRRRPATSSTDSAPADGYIELLVAGHSFDECVEAAGDAAEQWWGEGGEFEVGIERKAVTEVVAGRLRFLVWARVERVR